MKALLKRIFDAIIESRTRSAERYIKQVLGEEHISESVKPR